MWRSAGMLNRATGRTSRETVRRILQPSGIPGMTGAPGTICSRAGGAPHWCRCRMPLRAPVRHRRSRTHRSIFRRRRTCQGPHPAKPTGPSPIRMRRPADPTKVRRRQQANGKRATKFRSPGARRFSRRISVPRDLRAGDQIRKQQLRMVRGGEISRRSAGLW